MLFSVDISFASNSFIIRDNIIKVYVIRKLVKFTIYLFLFKPKQETHGPHRSPEKTAQNNKHI